MPLEVVYLDDNEDLCVAFSDLFSSDQVNIRTYTDPQSAILEIRKNPPDLLFIDYRLPKTTGEAVAFELNTSIRTFLVSGEISLKVAYPFEKIFAKPYDIAQLESIISAAVAAKAMKATG